MNEVSINWLPTLVFLYKFLLKKNSSVNLKSNGTNYTTQPSANRWDLAAGTYFIKWRAPMYFVNRHKAYVYDLTNSAQIGMGSSAFPGDDQTDSVGQARVTISGNTTYELFSRGTNSQSTYGWGVESNFGSMIEVYSEVEIYKEAS